MSLIIAVDFDGTVVDHMYPVVGQDVPGAVEALKELTNAGCKLILWTMRDGQELHDAIHWFRTHDLWLYGIQHNPTQDNWTKSPKAYAQIYIDDAAYGCPLIQVEGFNRRCVDWTNVVKNILGK